MVSKKLQDKFYAALESLKDGKNDYILEALAAGAKATFEGLIRGEVTADGTYIPPKDERPDSDSIGPDSGSKFLTLEDLRRLTHDLDTENEENPEELNFDGNEAKRFPTYPGQFSEEEDPFYSMVAEAVTKLGNTINEMKTADNAPLIEAIKEGFNCCFEATDYHPVTEGLGNFVKKVFGKKENKEQPEQAKQTEVAKEETDDQRQGKAWATQIAKAIKETGFTISDDWKIYNKNSKIVGGFSGPDWADVSVYWRDDLDEPRPSSLCNFTNPNFKSPDKVIALWKKDAEYISNLGG